MSERPVSPCPGADEGHGALSSHDRSSSDSQQQLSQSSRDAQPSPVLNVFSDEFSLERLENPSNSQRRSLNSISSQSSSSSDKTETERDGHVPPMSPFQGRSESLERRASQILQQQQQQQQTVLPQMPDKIHFPSDVCPVPRTSSPTASIAQSTTSAGHRSVSTISRFSIPPRALSPYTGQTGPSHPYAMYSQGISVNRTSSISSNSTTRPVERNFVAAAPPQHPYALYSQNTVPEHVPDEPLNTTVPLILPGHPQTFTQTTQSPVADEVGDILGTDGYREQLPPYSRYPDGIPEKSYYAPATPLGVVTAANTSPQPLETPVSPMSQVSSRTLLTENAPTIATPPTIVPPPPDSSSAESGNISSEKVDEKDRRRNKKICCGLPLWIIGLIAIGLVTGTLIGGVLGGIVGARQGQKDSNKPGPDPDHQSTVTATATATTSGTLDAIPLPTATSISFSPIPTGDISISGRTLNSESQSCVNSTSLKPAWGCIPYGHFKGSIYGGANDTRSIKFTQTPLTGKFIYGDQVPALADKEYPLETVVDSTSVEEGPAYFFYTTFDKLVIIPDDEFPPNVAGGQVDESNVIPRSTNRSKVQSVPGDKPWFCWWNTTHIETFIYANKDASEDDMRTNGEDPDIEIYPTGTASPRQATPTMSPESATSMPISTAGDGNLPQSYARVVKIKELRFSDASPSPPYCQQMQVLDDWSLSMLKNSTIIQEKDSEAGPRSDDDTDIGDISARSTKVIKSREVGSDQCYCEWIYGN
ncbi:uncharacterized protein GIQ15_01064 [Arthroderma uncinatum]|uniref:uncharacterized protein n=1 Tax=Arthroderma uncinatum TaxID=74035 RepID=UPI00144ACC2E|nr:uncharacterized protein GIQ15_01064 [Arthroderma uncinatum]KAF3491547.1 hypothetical protein GIQ15_01064 [Arthroderma uncinatum]